MNNRHLTKTFLYIYLVTSKTGETNILKRNCNAQFIQKPVPLYQVLSGL